MLQIREATIESQSVIDIAVDRLHQGAAVIVGTQRLRHLIEDNYNLSMLNAGKSVWSTPEVVSWDVWLGDIWREFELSVSEPVEKLLSRGQSQLVWESVIDKFVREAYHKDFEYLLWHITATANRAKEAYSLVCGYRIDITDDKFGLGDDTSNFLVWLREYKKLLKRRRCIDFDVLPDRIMENVEKIAIDDGLKFVIAGFDEITPQQTELIECFESHGWKSEILTNLSRNSTSNSSVQQFQFDAFDLEVETCARWARAVIEASPQSHQVGVVLSDVAQSHKKIYRTFSKFLNPDAILENRELNQMSFHITMGSGLASSPIVVDAMNLFQLIRPAVEVSVMSSVIRSNRIKGWNEEMTQRSNLANEVYRLGSDRISIDDLLSLAKQKKKHLDLECPKLVALLIRAQKIKKGKPVTAQYYFWGRFFMDWMGHFQSNNKGGLNIGVDETTDHEALVDIIQGLAELGCVSSKVSVETVMAKLVRRIDESSVQPRASRVPIQIGGAIALAGQKFTHLWMLGMNSEAYPGTPRPNPFIPIAIQKEKNIPDCSVESLQERSQRRIEWLLASAEYVVQSFAQSDGNEHYQACSELRNLERFDNESGESQFNYRDYISLMSNDLGQIEFFEDWRAPSLGKTNSGKFPGGTNLVKNQSQCSFRAFAQHRLNLNEIPTLEIGVGALLRGSLVHTVLENFFNDYGTGEKIQQLIDADRIDDVIRDFAQNAVREEDSKRIRQFNDEILDVEQQILVGLVSSWVGMDPLLRDGGEVYANELETKLESASLELEFIIDRVDKLAGDLRKGASLRIIDYKTGEAKLKNLYGDRPEEPQLLLYARAMEGRGETVGSIGYAQVKPADIKYLRYPDMKKGKPDEYLLDDEKQDWWKILDQIMENFKAGVADVDPKKPPETCKHCSFGPVCRVGHLKQ